MRTRQKPGFSIAVALSWLDLTSCGADVDTQYNDRTYEKPALEERQFSAIQTSYPMIVIKPTSFPENVFGFFHFLAVPSPVSSYPFTLENSALILASDHFAPPQDNQAVRLDPWRQGNTLITLVASITPPDGYKLSTMAGAWDNVPVTNTYSRYDVYQRSVSASEASTGISLHVTFEKIPVADAPQPSPNQGPQPYVQAKDDPIFFNGSIYN